MIRSLHSAVRMALRTPALPLFPHSLLAYRMSLLPMALLYRPLASFCQEPPSHPLLNLLQEVKEDKLEQPLADILKLNSKNKEKALYILISRVAKDTLPPRILMHPTFEAHIKQFPVLQVRAMLIRVDQELEQLGLFIEQKNEDGKKVAVKDINNCFTIVFNNFKKIDGQELETLEAEACKSFADYHYEYLLRIVDHRRAREVLKKALEFYKAALTKYCTFLKQKEAEEEGKEYNGEQENLKEVPAEEMTTEQRKQVMKTIEYIRFDIAESYSEVLFKVLEVQNYLTDPRIKTNRPFPKEKIPFAYHSGLFPILPLFEPVVTLFGNNQMRYQSLHYYKIAKAYLELKFYCDLELKSQGTAEGIERISTEFEEIMEKLVREIVGVLEIMPYNEDTIDHQEGLCEVLLGIRSNRLSRMGLSREDFQIALVHDIKQILAMIKVEDVRKLITANFCNVVQEIMGIDLQMHLGKLPRSTRFPAKLRKKRSP